MIITCVLSALVTLIDLFGPSTNVHLTSLVNRPLLQPQSDIYTYFPCSWEEIQYLQDHMVRKVDSIPTYENKKNEKDFVEKI